MVQKRTSCGGQPTEAFNGEVSIGLLAKFAQVSQVCNEDEREKERKKSKERIILMSCY